MQIAGARFLVIGGVHRLGRAVALDLAAHGGRVCVSSRSSGEAAAQVAALETAGATAAAAVTGDVRRPEAAAALVAAGAAALGGLDGLVYAASGPFTPTPPQQLDEAAWDAAFDTVAKGFFFAACAAYGQLTGRGGVVVAITDCMGLQPWANFAAHGAAKAAEIHLVKELALAWREDGVRVCGVAPGPVDLVDDEHREATQRAAARTGMDRLVDPAAVGAAVRFCFTTDGVTGVNVIVDNGSLLNA